jgi:hypothetical protein
MFFGPPATPGYPGLNVTLCALSGEVDRRSASEGICFPCCWFGLGGAHALLRRSEPREYVCRAVGFLNAASEASLGRMFAALLVS